MRCPVHGCLVEVKGDPDLDAVFDAITRLPESLFAAVPEVVAERMIVEHRTLMTRIDERLANVCLCPAADRHHLE